MKLGGGIVVVGIEEELEGREWEMNLNKTHYMFMKFS